MRAFAPAAALRRPVTCNLRRGHPQPPDVPIRDGLWPLRLLESYPYKLARRANPPPQRRKLKPPPDTEVTREAADAAAAKLKAGAEGFISKGNSMLQRGGLDAATRFAMYALGTSKAVSTPALRERAYELLRRVQAAAVVADWRRAVAHAAAEEQQADLAEAGDEEAQRHSRGRAGSTPKPRQGWTKALMRQLNARICVACRIIRPGALMWRVMHIKRPRGPGEVIKPRRLRLVRRRLVWLPEQRVAGAPASTATVSPGAASLAAMPEKTLYEKKAKLKATRAAEAAASRGRVAIQRLPGGASEAMQADDALWAPPARGVRSAYVCRSVACVRNALKLKLFNKGLRGPVKPEVAEALVKATELEVAAAATRPPGAPPPGVGPELAARIAALEPRVPPRPTGELRGPHDNWVAPPTGPRRA